MRDHSKLASEDLALSSLPLSCFASVPKASAPALSASGALRVPSLNSPVFDHMRHKLSWSLHASVPLLWSTRLLALEPWNKF